MTTCTRHLNFCVPHLAVPMTFLLLSKHQTVTEPQKPVLIEYLGGT